MSESDTRKVHALFQGLPLCQFTSDLPRDWPSGHVWTNVDDIEHITCVGCKEEAKKLKKR